jgi:hypothetical protein
MVSLSCKLSSRVGTAHTSNLRNPVSLSARAPLPTLRTATPQFVTSVLMRLGTSPTGTTAFTVMLCVSIAVTDLIAALEM